MGQLTLTFKVKLRFEVKIYPFWACPYHNSPPIEVRISKFGPKGVNQFNIRLEGPEDPHLGNSRFGGSRDLAHTLQYLWPRPPGVWLGGPGCKPGHSGWSQWSSPNKKASGLIPVKGTAFGSWVFCYRLFRSGTVSWCDHFGSATWEEDPFLVGGWGGSVGSSIFTINLYGAVYWSMQQRVFQNWTSHLLTLHYIIMLPFQNELTDTMKSMGACVYASFVARLCFTDCLLMHHEAKFDKSG